MNDGSCINISLCQFPSIDILFLDIQWCQNNYPVKVSSQMIFIMLSKANGIILTSFQFVSTKSKESYNSQCTGLWGYSAGLWGYKLVRENQSLVGAMICIVKGYICIYIVNKESYIHHVHIYQYVDIYIYCGAGLDNIGPIAECWGLQGSKSKHGML